MNMINPLPNNFARIIVNNQAGTDQNSTKNFEKNKDKIKEITEEFESFLLYYLLKSMREAIPKSDLLHSNAEDIFTSMLDEEIAKNSIKKDGGLGLAKIMQQQITQSSNKNMGKPNMLFPKSKNNYQAVFPNYR